MAVLSALLIYSADAGELDLWLSRSAEARPYEAIAGNLREIVAGAAADGVAERLLLDRIVEGARKKASADRLLQAVEAEADRLSFLARSLAEGWPDTNAKRRETVLAELSLALRSGVDREEWGRASRSVLDAKGAPERAVAIVDLLASIDPARLIPAEDRLALVGAIAASRFRTDSIDSLVAVFTRGRARGLSPALVARAIAEGLAAGGNLASVDRVLEGYRRDR